MNTSTHLGRLGGVAVKRRSFLGMVAAGAAVSGVPALLTACSSSDAGAPGGAAGASGGASADVLPTYKEQVFATPDFPSVNGSTAGYTTIPQALVRSVPEAPGKGTEFTAMTPLWGTPPPVNGNKYYDAVNAVLGSKISFQISDGNDYGTVLATALSAPSDLADWVCVPVWNIPPRFASEIVPNVFQDLTDYLAGDKALAYPNLANLPTAAWKFGTFNDRLYALPFPGEVITDAIFYRKDLLAALGITPDVKSADDLLALLKKLNNPSGGVYAAADLWNTSTAIHGVVPKWEKQSDGTLRHRVETDAYRAALEWNASVWAAGLVHPDVDTSSSKDLFESGKLLVMNDGVGGWHEALGRQLKDNPTYDQQPLAPFGADGGDPIYYKGQPANIFSFLKKSDDKDRINELLALANVLAAPFGTTEFDLLNNGVEGVHFTKDANGLPVPTALASTELAGTYIFLVDPPVVNAKVQYPGYVKAFSEVTAKLAKFAVEPMFYGQQIVEPDEYASIGQPFIDLEKDISRGRKPISALDDALATWKSSGGDQLREFYQGLLKA
jgi:putative aldouronate transport system substrate-binding protein